jgi:hypothetical protein
MTEGLVSIFSQGNTASMAEVRPYARYHGNRRFTYSDLSALSVPELNAKSVMVIVAQETFVKTRGNRCFRSTQVNCETDFVGKNDNFQDLARKCAEVALGLGDAGQAIADIDPEFLKNASMPLSRTHFLIDAYSFYWVFLRMSSRVSYRAL